MRDEGVIGTFSWRRMPLDANGWARKSRRPGEKFPTFAEVRAGTFPSAFKLERGGPGFHSMPPRCQSSNDGIV